jgi:hypothetical protein
MNAGHADVSIAREILGQIFVWMWMPPQNGQYGFNDPAWLDPVL